MEKIEFEKNAVIQKNVKIDRDLVEKAEAFEKKLSELGERTKSKYTLTPPLNTSNAYFFNR
ncbi:MAG: hypothetical protein ABII75_08345 [Candidatus Omnitrophota bacterium]